MNTHWHTLAIHSSYGCWKKCPFCYLQEAPGQEKSINYFKRLLELAQAIKNWVIAINHSDNDHLQTSEALIQQARTLNHPYSITTNYENLLMMNTSYFTGADQVVISVDEYKIAEHDFYLFAKTMAGAKEKGINILFAITLTPRMIEKIMHGHFLNIGMALAEKIYLVMPKSTHYPNTSIKKLKQFCDYLRLQIRDFEVYKKIAFDHCLQTQLTPWKSIISNECAYNKVLTLMPDGGVRVCPYEKSKMVINEPKEIIALLEQGMDPKYLEQLKHCGWRHLIQNIDEEQPGRQLLLANVVRKNQSQASLITAGMKG